MTAKPDLLRAVGAMVLLLTIPASPQRVGAQSIDPDFPIVNGPVFSMALSEGTLYLGGDFTRIGPAVGSAAAVDTATFAASPQIPVVVGSVMAITPDGSGGWYLGGQFSSVGGVPRANLAHVTAGGAVSDWNPGTDGAVRGIAVGDGVVFVYGWFSVVGSQPRNGIAAVSISSGLVTPWAEQAVGDVHAIAVSEHAIFVGGGFFWWGTEPRSHLVALDPATADVLPWDATLDGEVTSLHLDGATLYVGGRFTQVAGLGRRGLAALDVATAAARPWTAGDWADVYAIEKTDRDLYVSGLRLIASQPPRYEVCALDSEVGPEAVFEWVMNAPATTLAVSGSALFAGGGFTTIAGQGRHHLAVMDRRSGQVGAWDPQPDALVSALAAQGGHVSFGGDFRSIGGVERSRLAAIDVVTGAVTDWNPRADGRISTLLVQGQTVFAGGSFGRIGDHVRVRAAAIDRVSGDPMPWNPGVNATVEALGWFDSKLVLAGAFTNLGGVPRQRIAMVDPVTAVIQPWSTSVDGSLYAMAIRDTTIYVAGIFNNAGGQQRRRLAAFDARTGAVSSWNPVGSDHVFAIGTTDTTVIVGGSFSTIGGQVRRAVAAVDRGTGLLLPWDAQAIGQVSAIALQDRNVLLGGVFSAMGGASRNSLAAVDASTGQATSWDPSANPTVRAIVAEGGVVYAGGWFQSMGGEPHAHLAKIVSHASELQVEGAVVAEGDEGTTTAIFTVSLTQPSDEYVSIDYATADGTATASSEDYQSIAGSLVFEPGETQRLVHVSIHGDTLREDDETLVLRIFNASGAQILVPSATGTISDDDLYRGGRVDLFRATSDAGDAVGLGARYFVAAPTGVFIAGGGREIARVITTWEGHTADVTFASPRGVPLDVGEYPDGARHPFQSPHQPALNAKIDGRQCPGAATSFEIHEIRRDAQDDVQALWATFEQHCNGGPPALRGEVVYNVDIALHVRTPQIVSTQILRPVTFTVSALEARGAPVVLQASGLPPGAMFMDHGDNSGTFEWAGGASALDTLVVTFTGTNPSGYSSSSTTELRIVGPDFVAFVGDSADFVTQGRPYLFDEANATFERWSSGYGAVSVRAKRPGDEFHLAFAAPAPRALTPGRFVADLRPNPPGISLSGNSRGCNFSRGWFDVREVVYGATGEVESFWAVFERVCLPANTWTRGEVRLNADTTLYVTPPADAFMIAGTDTAITVRAVDTRGLPVSLVVFPLPPGADFVDHGDGTGTLRWPAVPADPETLTVHFTATNSEGRSVSAPTWMHVADVGVPTNSVASLISAGVLPDGVDLLWHATVAGPVMVERTGESGDWSVIGETEHTARDRLYFRDSSVQPGAQYGYRLVLQHTGDKFVSGEVWVKVPEWTLALEPPYPNPLTGPIHVEFTLARSGPVRLTLVDVAGRRVAGTDLNHAAVGRHMIQIASGATLSPGMYWIVLHQAGERRTRTIIVRH